MSSRPQPSVGYGATMVTISQVITVGATGLLSLVIARSLGPSGTGAFNLFQTALLMLALLASLGIENGVMFHVGGGRWPAPDALRHTTLAAIGLGTLGAAIGAVIALATADSLFDGIDIELVLLGMLATPFLLWWTYGSFLALATGDYGAYLRGPATQAALSLLFVAPGALVWELPGAIGGLVASHVVAAALLWVKHRGALGHPGDASEPALSQLRRAASFGLPAQLTNALSLVSYRADLFVLNAVSTTAAVGQYAIATSLTSLGWVAPRAVSAVILPRVAALEDDEDEGAQGELIAKAVRHAVILAVVTTALLAVAVAAIPLIYGEEFEPAVTLGLLLLPGIATLGVGNVLASSILGKGAPRYGLIVALITTPLAILLYLVVVPAYGARGAAVASSVVYTTSALLFLHFFRRVTGVQSLRALIPRADDLRDYALLASAARERLRRSDAASS
jgi:O-antigen/teichoic acid export membrane protein